MHRLSYLKSTLRLSEMHNCVIISEEIDLVDSQWLGSGLLDQVLDGFVGRSLNKITCTCCLVTTLTFLL
jgi:hypothetical protein